MKVLWFQFGFKKNKTLTENELELLIYKSMIVALTNAITNPDKKSGLSQVETDKSILERLKHV